ncbi:MAG: GH92 family glycosyl hydrolase, partial [Kiritimatiellia bacterium]
RLTFPQGRQGGVLLDFPWGLYREKSYLPNLTTACRAERVSPRRWRGLNHSEIWAPRDIGYVVEFSREPERVVELPRAPGDKGPRVAALFAEGGVVEVAVAVSAKSVEGAERNFAAEAGESFEGLVAGTRAAWEPLLARAKVAAAPEGERASVATAVYHLCIQPNDIADAGEAPRYSTFSLWDTFRNAHPLYETLVPERVGGFVNSLLAHYDQWGYLPQWELWGRETGGMIGSHAVPVVVDACLHGFEGIDAEKAYRAVRDTLTKSERPGKGKTYPRRTDWEVYDRYGYYPFDVIRRESVSRTLECCFDDFKAAQLARRLGKVEDAAFFTRRSWNFTNLFDRATLCFRGRDSKGNWRTPFEPARVGSTPDYTEATALQYSWHVLHRPEWLVEAMGGREAFIARLDGFFAGTLFPGMRRDYEKCQDISGMIGDYAHGNEPCHHITGLYRLVGRPEKADELNRRICRMCYRAAPDGLCGNDDCGQMSAWYLQMRAAAGR